MITIFYQTERQSRFFVNENRQKIRIKWVVLISHLNLHPKDEDHEILNHN